MTDPRNISPRSDIFLSVVGPYVGAIDAAAHDAPYLVKGLTMDQRRAKLSTLAEYDTFIEIDYSRFDKTLDQPIIVDVEMQLFEYVYPRDAHPLLWEALSLLPWTKGRSVVGLSYTVAGTRLSGDSHTSVFNGFDNSFFKWLVLEDIPRPIENHGFHEGDDGDIGIRGQDRAQAESNISFLCFLGLVVKVKITDLLEDTTFCGRFYTFDGQMRDMCDLKRTLAKFHITCSGLSARRAMVAKAFSYWATDKDTPIVGTLCYVILKLYVKRWDLSHIARSGMNLFEKERIISGFNEELVHVWPPASKYALASHRSGYSISLLRSYEDMFLSWLDVGAVPASFPQLENEDLACDDSRAVIQQSYGRYYGF